MPTFVFFIFTDQLQLMIDEMFKSHTLKFKLNRNLNEKGALSAVAILGSLAADRTDFLGPRCC